MLAIGESSHRCRRQCKHTWSYLWLVTRKLVARSEAADIRDADIEPLFLYEEGCLDDVPDAGT